MPKAFITVQPEDKDSIKKLKNVLEYSDFYSNNFIPNYKHNFSQSYDAKFIKKLPPAPASEPMPDASPKKSRTGKTLNILQEYTENSSVHGVPYLGHHPVRKTAFELFVWVCVMISAIVCLSLLIKQFWHRYVTNPTSTYVTSFHAPIFVSPFPAVTICPFTPTPANTTNKILETLKIPPNMTKDDVIFYISCVTFVKSESILLKYANHLSNPIKSESHKYQKPFSRLLKFNGLKLIEFVKMTRRCDDMIEFATWNNHLLSKNKFKISFGKDGVCCSYNYLLEGYMRKGRGSPKPTLLRTDQFGERSGLFVALQEDLFPDEDFNNIERITTESIGVAIYIHHSMEFPGANTPTYILQEGHELQLSVEPTYNLKPINFRRPDNSKECTAEDEAELTYFPDYRYSNCFAECRIKAGLQLCGCVLSNLYQPVIETKKLMPCVLEDFPCWRTFGKSIRIVKDVNMKNFSCSCRTKCRSATYKARPTLVHIEDLPLSYAAVYRNISKDQAIFRVYFASQVYRHWETTPAATELSLLSNLGGIFSLFLGCSFVSAVEIMYFLSYVIAAIASCD